ncbi:MAG: bifunctional (p)ppGpp synthetase/guanosine-3',5'-bis(diphosphate) 3'-pyrophosphohydrolase [Pseudomonadales bacterium]|nr:bifunctional (p)ppGpp synthetase/guanosine-3',5'-bis(diphosphate) 3'-pyrophosphohydrolase [Pseudomonadales bacterium]
MVKAKVQQTVFEEGAVDVAEWITDLGSDRPDMDLARIEQACELSAQAESKAIQMGAGWPSGRSSYWMGLEIADILREFQVDEDGLIAAIIYRAVREHQITLNHARKQFGDKVGDLVEGVLKMAAISNIHIRHNAVVLGETSDQIEQAKKMLVALVDDIRVALIKLAERTCAIRAVGNSERSKQIRLAQEISEIYAPLAHRLGIGHLKWELEDLAFRYTEPKAYKRIANLLDEKRTDRDQYIETVLALLDAKLTLVTLESELEGRAKHICSIWKKMNRKGIPFSEVYDVRAIRILVSTSDDCYRALGVVHNLWRNIPNEFDDYIANPKDNGYQSLHTAVIGPEGKVLEVQIRTLEMHHEAEYGVCAHWTYKDHVKGQRMARYERRLAWLRQVIEWQDEVNNLPESASEMMANVSLDRVYLFTPEGHVIDMPPGATPVDFAYKVHTEIGHQCRGAKVNGKVVPLNHVLISGDHVEIITGQDSVPRREWLHSHLGYVTTSKAKAKIQSWFGLRERQKNLEEGQRLLKAELQQLGLDSDREVSISGAFNFESDDDFLVALGSGDLQLTDVAEWIAEHELDIRTSTQLPLAFKQDELPMLINGLGGRRHEIASCCNPVLGDSIVGIISDAGLVHVHVQACVEVLQGDPYGRLMRLSWQDDIQAVFSVELEVEAYERSGLLFDITGLFVTEAINVTMMHSVTDREAQRVQLSMTVEVASLKTLIKVLEMMQKIPNVVSARRAATKQDE